MTVFEAATFEGPANFKAAQVESAFSLAGTVFHQVPDFNQTHCAEAPRFDDLHIRRGLVEPGSFWQSIVKAPKPFVTSNYRSLKRLAIQGHDHEKEQEFFASELRTRRGVNDFWWQPRWWFGVFYELLSDYGRSLLRPFFIWTGMTLAFALFYLCEHISRAGDRVFALMARWIFDVLQTGLQAIGASPDVVNYYASSSGIGLKCLAGDGADGAHPASAALALSLRKGLLFPGLGDGTTTTQSYACLYGFNSAFLKDFKSPQLVLMIPDSVATAGMFQTLFSLVLIFLLLLALRNHFKLR